MKSQLYKGQGGNRNYDITAKLIIFKAKGDNDQSKG